MPELPEVETIRAQLAPVVEGRRLLSVEVLDPRWSRPLAPAELAAALQGRTVRSLGRRGKYLLWHLSGDVHLAQHLRMTGAVLVDPRPEPAHTRVRIRLGARAGTPGIRLAVTDPRRFGTAELLLGDDALQAFLDARLGPEPFGPAFTAEHLRAVARGRRAPIKALLLDQRSVAGVGNIYADEALFAARIHPLRAAGSLRGPELARLRDAVVAALDDGIDARGASIDDFRHIDGLKGSFQDRFLVHRREGEPCPRCGGTIAKMVVAGRGTYVCESCQPRPRRRAGAGGGSGRAAAGAGARGQRAGGRVARAVTGSGGEGGTAGSAKPRPRPASARGAPARGASRTPKSEPRTTPARGAAARAASQPPKSQRRTAAAPARGASQAPKSSARRPSSAAA